MRKLRKAVAVLRDNCRGMTLPEFAAFLRLVLFRDEEILIYAASLPAAGTEPVTGPRVVKGRAADLAAARDGDRSVPWELQCDEYDGVRDFFVYTEDGRLGHISWLYYERDPNRILRLGAGECEVKFCLTLPEFRGRGLYPAALRAIQRYLGERGYRRCFICVRPDNGASIRGIEKAGFVRAGSTRLRKVLGVQVSRPQATRVLQLEEERRWIA